MQHQLVHAIFPTPLHTQPLWKIKNLNPNITKHGDVRQTSRCRPSSGGCGVCDNQTLSREGVTLKEDLTRKPLANFPIPNLLVPGPNLSPPWSPCIRLGKLPVRWGVGGGGGDNEDLETHGIPLSLPHTNTCHSRELKTTSGNDKYLVLAPNPLRRAASVCFLTRPEGNGCRGGEGERDPRKGPQRLTQTWRRLLMTVSGVHLPPTWVTWACPGWRGWNAQGPGADSGTGGGGGALATGGGGLDVC